MDLTDIPRISNKAKICFGISLFMLITSLTFISLSLLKYNSPVLLGLDFAGGTKLTYEFTAQKLKSPLTSENVRKKVLTPVSDELAASSIAQIAEGKFLILRSKELSLSDKESISEKLEDTFGKFKILSVDTISATLGPELLRSGLIALLVALLAIASFVSYRFRKDFAICAILALIHDVLIVVGLFAALGLLKQIEVNSLFLVACLTVLGFSVHDTIVVFDRVRENMQYLSKKNPFARIIDLSISQVWFRSFCTSLTMLLVLGALLFWGGDTLKVFSGAMFIGMLVGTYSSLFVASLGLEWLNSKFDFTNNKKSKSKTA